MQLSTHLAEEHWARHVRSDPRPPPTQPTLAIFVGIPLSGKSTVAKALTAAATTRTLHVENDALREEVSLALGQPSPVHDRRENFLTYQTAWKLTGLALDGGANTIHDATNLTEAGRRGAYDEADLRAVPVVVVFVQTAREVMDARAMTLAATRQEAYAKLGRKQPDPASCGRPLVIIDGAEPVAENMVRLTADPHLAGLFPTA